MSIIENISHLPFVVANHPPSYDGFDFLSVVQQSNTHNPIVGVIDNVDSNGVRICIFDLCNQEGINVDVLLSITQTWYDTHKQNVPLSFFLSRTHNNAKLSSLYKTIPLKNIIRIIGPVSIFCMEKISKVSKRKIITSFGKNS